MGVRRLLAVAFEGETEPQLAELVDEITWVKVGQLSKMIAALKEHGARHCVMLGQIAPKHLFDLRPDFRAVAMLLRLKEKNAHTVFGAIIEELAKEGIEVVEASRWLRPLMAGPRVSARSAPPRATKHRCPIRVSHRQGHLAPGDWTTGGGEGRHGAGRGRV
jgi:DUF1009 family protein